MKVNFVFMILFYLLSLVLAQSAIATTFTTIYSGYWNNNNIWQNGMAPSYTTGDTIIIKNFIEFTSTIELIGPAFLRIDSTGALCGHDTIVSNSGTAITTYGILECDILMVPGGYILFNAPGTIILTQYGILSNGAYLHSNASLQVGPWFNCISKSSAVEENELNKFSFYPNPATNQLNIVTDELFDEYIIYDLSGRVLQSGIYSSAIDISPFSEGCYVIRLQGKNFISQRKFIKVSLRN